MHDVSIAQIVIDHPIQNSPACIVVKNTAMQARGHKMNHQNKTSFWVTRAQMKKKNYQIYSNMWIGCFSDSTSAMVRERWLIEVVLKNKLQVLQIRKIAQEDRKKESVRTCWGFNFTSIKNPPIYIDALNQLAREHANCLTWLVHCWTKDIKNLIFYFLCFDS